MRIEIKTIPHSEQLYNTIGDWRFDEEEEDLLHIYVSDVGNQWYEYLIAGHELREAMLCKRYGITEKAVTEFDKKYEQKRKRGDVDKESEPGDDPIAPYYQYHQFSTFLERLEAVELGIDWFEYEKKLNKVYTEVKKEK